MELKVIKNINEPRITNISVAMSHVQRQKVDALKLTYKIDVNQMIRDYIDEIFDAAKKGRLVAKQD